MVVEDLVTSGASVLETLEPLQKEQLVVRDVVVLIDREQGGEQHLAANGLRLHAAFKLSAMLDVLQKHSLVTDATADAVRAFIAGNQTKLPAPAAAATATLPTRCVPEITAPAMTTVCLALACCLVLICACHTGPCAELVPHWPLC